MAQPTLLTCEASLPVPSPWHPPSEPPTEDGRYLVRWRWDWKVGYAVLDWYRDAGWTGTYWRIREGATHWMAIPPIEEDEGWTSGPHTV